ncbi:MAG TPA: glycosyltransferase family 87 protein [Stellaceae bacterium]|nr:glycosyltransferase family 87 protein [Stellaceae bacterium]
MLIASEPVPTGSIKTRPMIFRSWALHTCGWIIAAMQIGWFILAYRAHGWLADGEGVPRYLDFTTIYTTATLALKGQAGLIDSPAKFLHAQDAVVGAGKALYTSWPHPPTILLFLAPLALVPYLMAFLIWELTTLLGYIATIYAIARRSAAIALVLASPFTAANFGNGNVAFLSSSLLGTSLLLLERRPILAGAFIGILTIKPHWGILVPIALVTSGQWRAIGSAIVVAIVFAVASATAFGVTPWLGLPAQIATQAVANLSYRPETLSLRYDPRETWYLYQTVFGLARALHFGPVVAWSAQAVSTCGSALIVWLVWRSKTRYSLKAATLAAGVLLATPYGYSTDLTAVAVSIAFLARDQILYGLLKGEELMLLAVAFGLLERGLFHLPIGSVVIMLLMFIILRRVFACWGQHPRRAPLLPG